MSALSLQADESRRHSCGEANPADASFCGGCGVGLSAGAVCAGCQRQCTPGARFCQGCGVSLVPAAQAGSPAAEERVQAVEGEVAALRQEIADLVVLREQLDGALKRIRQRSGGAPPPSKAAPTAKASAPPETTEESTAEVPAAAPEASQSEAAPPADEPEVERVEHVCVIHIEDRPDLQEAVQAAVTQYKTASYHAASEIDEGLPSGARLPVVNLLSSGDPLAAIADPGLGMESVRAFTYVTDGRRGFLLGVTSYFPPPLDPSTCADRILANLPASPRVLVVSGAVLGTPELRAHLVRQGCTTSIAFDERQALGLIPSVRPSLVLIDLNLPRGEGLRLAGRIRAEDPNRYVRFAFLWQQKMEPALLRQFATRAANDFQFSEEDLRRQLMQEFNPGGAAYVR